MRDQLNELANRTSRGRGSALGLLVLIATQLAGCAQQTPPQPPITARETGSFNPPIILSGTPDRDAAAYNASEEQLSAADWHELEKLGPRPIWERLEALRCNHSHKHNSHGATTRPTITLLPTTLPSLPQAELPVQMVGLPDGKVRLIWTLRSYGGPNVKTSRDATTSRRTVEIAPADLTPLTTALTQTLGPSGLVTCLPRENEVVITCDKTMCAPLLNLLNDLDRPAQQVEITAKIFEVSHDFDFQQGTELVLNHLADSASQNLTSTFSAKRFLDALTNPTAAPVQGSVLRLVQAFKDAGVSVDVSFQLLADAGLIQVVSSPRMTVAVGQTGYMLAGQEIPIQSETLVNNNITLGTTYKPVGVQLYITPEAAGPNRVKLHTISIVSAVAGFNPMPSMNGNVVPLINPVIDSREAETAVTVEDGSTLVISGLQMVRTITRENKIPGLGDIPLVQWLFKNHRTQQEQTDLYFFITPTMLASAE